MKNENPFHASVADAPAGVVYGSPDMIQEPGELESLPEKNQPEFPRLEGANRPPKILLTSVFGPFGVDDAFGRKENILELFHNQVTKVQGLASLRFQHRSFGLYFLAENIDADVTVLDFPSRRRFIRELARGYDVVGISFITPNFVKAREMARLVRRHSPRSVIVLGGHGTAIEGVQKLIDCDHVVRGEGIRWMRRFLGEDSGRPLSHPILPANERRSVFGIPIHGSRAGLLVPGTGCPNRCDFCSTSHFFEGYIPFLATGRELFGQACRTAGALGDDTLFVMDENFLAERQRAFDLLAEMEKKQRWFNFHAFSSADNVLAFGVENLVRLGIHLIWIGVESPSGTPYAKNAATDLPRLVAELRRHGISVLASSMLCMPHHTPGNISRDIDAVVDMDADFVQFMLYTGLPQTALYRQLKESGQLREDLPFEEWHGQKMLNYHHPAFPGDEPEKWLHHAFDMDYQRNCSSIFRMVETARRGYLTLSGLSCRDACLDARLLQLRDRLRRYAGLLPVIRRYAAHSREKDHAATLEKELTVILGPPGFQNRLTRLAALVLAERWRWRVRLRGDVIQPRTLYTRYAPARSTIQRMTGSAGSGTPASLP